MIATGTVLFWRENDASAPGYRSGQSMSSSPRSPGVIPDLSALINWAAPFDVPLLHTSNGDPLSALLGGFGGP